MQTSLFSNLKRKDDIDIQWTPIKPEKKLTGASISRGSVMYPEDWRFFPFSSASAILSSNQFSLDKNSYKSTGISWTCQNKTLTKAWTHCKWLVTKIRQNTDIKNCVLSTCTCNVNKIHLCKKFFYKDYNCKNQFFSSVLLYNYFIRLFKSWNKIINKAVVSITCMCACNCLTSASLSWIWSPFSSLFTGPIEFKSPSQLERVAPMEDSSSYNEIITDYSTTWRVISTVVQCLLNSVLKKTKIFQQKYSLIPLNS